MGRVIRHIKIGSDEYPKRLEALGKDQPATFSVEGDFSPASSYVAIVGSRVAMPETIELAKRLAAAVVAANGVVISGGALGIDTAAHVGALEAGGRTWSVLGCGAPHTSPPENKDLFPRIVEGGGAIIRPFRDGTGHGRYKYRNGVLVALADTVIVVQAGLASGTLNAAQHAKNLKRDLYVVPGPPSLEKAFAGSWQIIKQHHSKVLHNEAQFIKKVLKVKIAPPKGLTDDELMLFDALGSGAKHPDQLTVETGLPAAAVSTALLTLALGDVVVEGSAGLFWRKKSVTG